MTIVEANDLRLPAVEKILEVNTLLKAGLTYRDLAVTILSRVDEITQELRGGK